jgi:hypothetical protein
LGTRLWVLGARAGNRNEDTAEGNNVESDRAKSYRPTFRGRYTGGRSKPRPYGKKQKATVKGSGYGNFKFQI